ncbi:MAG TPA: helix-turn-helix domain-containing protein [Draconibacterium sp.]|nr:helix-turn-helix domain-containing protein [Draconibacterium sp.]
MNAINTSNGDFLNSLQEIIQNNLKDPEFGVSVLAREAGMSRSNLHRKVFASAKISVSQFIRHERLKTGLKLLKHTSSTVSEIAYEVGFNNVSYFIKCFHDYYGYSPGQIGNREKEEVSAIKESKMKIKPVYFIGLMIILVSVISILLYSNSKGKSYVKKTIAVLPPYFENLEPEKTSKINSTVIQLINNLSYIKDLEIKPWTSVNQYKDPEQSASKIAKNLNVNFIVESSAEISNNNIQISVSLISGHEDKIVWSQPFEENLDNILQLSKKISGELVKQLKVQVTPAEKQRINKVLTSNKQAEIYYLQGDELFNRGKDKMWDGNNDLLNAIPWYKKAIEQDLEFAAAYAELCNIYYLLSGNSIEMYKNNITKYASLAMLYEPNTDKSLYAMALSLEAVKDYETAVIYLEKALEYNPNFADAYLELSAINTRQDISGPKIVEYVLKALRFATNENDSLNMARLHIQAAHALRQAGLYDEALIHINRSISLNPDISIFYIEKSEILILKEQNVDSANRLLNDLILQHPEFLNTKKYFFKNLFLNREFEKAYTSFKDLFELNSNGNFDNDIPKYRTIQRFVVTLEHLSFMKEFDLYRKILTESHIDSTHTFGPYFDSYELIRFYCVYHERDKAIQEMRNFSKQKYFLAQHIYHFEFSPVFDVLRGNKEYQEILAEIKVKFEANRDNIRKMIQEKELL